MTMHNDANHGPTGSVWTTKRSKPKGKEAEVGTTGNLSQCLGGDEVILIAKSGKRYKATVAWCYGDNQGAMVRMNDSLLSEDMKSISNPDARVEWRRVRPK